MVDFLKLFNIFRLIGLLDFQEAGWGSVHLKGKNKILKFQVDHLSL